MALSKEAQELLDEARDLGGLETRVEWFDTPGPFKELKDAGEVKLGGARGPDRAWVRMWHKDDEEMI